MNKKAEERKRVLVVDDDPGLCKVLRISLGHRGYDVFTTTSGAEAIDLIRMQEPDIVLLDVVMDDVTGFQVLENVRNFSRVPIIMFTGRSEVARIARQAGANDSIGKPFDNEELVEKIELALGEGQNE